MKMKRWSKKLVIIMIVMISMAVHPVLAQETIFDPIRDVIKTGSAKEMTKHLNQNIEINIEGNVNTYSIVQADLDAKENYWAVSNIDTYILDKLDNANYPGTECIFQVNYLPKKYSKVVDAGIR